MKASSILLCITVLTIGLIAYENLTITKGCTYTSVGVGLPDGYQTYSEHGQNELRSWLSQQGFVRAKDTKSYYVGVPVPGQKEWYVGRFEDSKPFYVVMQIPEKGRSGIYADVVWEYHGFRPSVNKSHRKAEQFAENLRAWYAKYERDHPMQEDSPIAAK